MRVSLDLYNRQKAENERLTKENKEQKLILEAINDEMNPLPFETDFDKAIKQAKSEAYREFADKVHDNFITKVQRRYCRINGEHSYKWTEGYEVDDVLSTIVTTLKELTESNE